MDKFCVFCRKKPQEKNKEHILPKWLIEFTGDPTREIYLGREWTDPELKKRQFSISSFTFPLVKIATIVFPTGGSLKAIMI